MINTNMVRSRYQGRGKLSFDISIEIQTEFELIIQTDGKAELYCKIEPSTEAAKLLKRTSNGVKPLLAKFEGISTTPQGKIVINELYLESFTLSFKLGVLSHQVKLLPSSPIEFTVLPSPSVPPEDKQVIVLFDIANFVFGGCDWSQVGDKWKRDKFTAVLDCKEITFRRIDDYTAIVKLLKKNKGILVTSQASSTIQMKELPELRQIINDALTLLSFASGTYLTYLREEMRKDGNLLKRIERPHVKTMLYHHRDFVIDCDNLEKCWLKEYLETTFSNYRQLKDELGLGIVIEYYVIAKDAQLLEVKYLLGAIALECLTSHLSEYFRKKGKTPDLSTFKNRMRALLAEFGVTYSQNELDFVDIRDKIVHTGRFPKGKDPVAEYQKLINFIDRTILSILGYKGGGYLDIANSYQKEILR